MNLSVVHNLACGGLLIDTDNSKKFFYATLLMEEKEQTFIERNKAIYYNHFLLIYLSVTDTLSYSI